MIISMIYMMPHPMVVLSWLIITMVAFYATSFDSIAFIASCYSYHRLEEGSYPSRKIEFIWCVLLIVLPIALLFSESSMANIQSVSIIAAFPLGIIIGVIIIGFIKDAGDFLKDR